MSAHFPLGVPWRVDARGRTAPATAEQHVADLVEAVLFCAPGERVNRPDFGCGLDRLVFAPVDAAILGATELQIRAGLQRWLAEVIAVEAVEVDLAEARLVVAVRYRILATGRSVAIAFERSG
jgi:uncharacterized protein